MKQMSIFAAACAAALFAGCQNVELARRENTPKEQDWEESIRKSYPGWTPRESVPAIETEAQAQAATADPAPMDTLPDASGAPLEVVAPAVAAPAAKEDKAASSEGAVNNVKAASSEDAVFTEYTVIKGDTLSSISKKVYGDGRQYYRIYKANSAAIADPNRLKVGTKLRIPEGKKK